MIERGFADKLEHDLSKYNFGNYGPGIRHMTDRTQAAADERETLLKRLDGRILNLNFDFNQTGSQSKQNVEIESISFQPISKKMSAGSPAHTPPLALLAAKKLQIETVTNIAERKK